ncbi:MAG TPA: heme-copper oxidase subunit III [Pyrinomonadaceae bacterium]
MATMVTTRPVTTKSNTGGTKFPGPNGNGKNGHHRFEPDSNANRYRLGMWVALASIAMLFTALSSAYIVRAGSSNDWVSLTMPRVLLLSTAILLASSVTLELARRNLKAASFNGYARWILITMLLGLSFLGTQLLAWRALARQGVYLVSNPHSSFFYLLTAAHAVHLIGGLLALIFLWIRTLVKREVKVTVTGQAAADAVSIYWHFMDGLWIYLFLLLFLWR